MMGMPCSFLSGCASALRASHRSTLACRIAFSAIIALGISSSLNQQAPGAIVTLTDNNSSIDFDTSSQLNSHNWLVDGISHLSQQAFWYRIGNVAEQALYTVSHTYKVTDANQDPGDDTISFRYTQAGSFQADIVYSLGGGSPGSGSAGLTENITIKNLSASPLDFHFFQYSDFDLAGTSANDGGIFTNLNAVQQIEGVIAFGETVVTTVPQHRELGIYPATLNKLNDGGPTTLSDTPIGLPVGPGNVTWAYQWDFSIPAGGSVNIGKAKNILYIPEPGSALLMGVSALVVLGIHRRSQAS